MYFLIYFEKLLTNIAIIAYNNISSTANRHASWQSPGSVGKNKICLNITQERSKPYIV